MKHSGASSSSTHGSPAAVTLAPTNGGESNHYSQTRKNLLANTSHATTSCCNGAIYIFGTFDRVTSPFCIINITFNVELHFIGKIYLFTYKNIGNSCTDF